LRPLEDYEHDPGGWTVYTTRLALLSLLDATEFRAGVETVVRLGGDADTNGAVAGALLGARFGASKIPSLWLEHLAGSEDLLRLI
jgi:ADP-ribosylglycohydrolase